jgi:hypothetical protein
LRWSIARYEDAQGQLVTNGGLDYALREQRFDENGRVFLEWQLGCPESSGAPAWSYDTEYHRTGARKRITLQACDAERKPLPYISTGTGSRTEREFDTIERLERMSETGFNEKVAGFSSREAKFSGGTLQSVTHKRSDGSTVETVAAIITYVTLAQPKSAEIKAGDQLLTVNGTPVPSAYHFVFTPFPGGWVEVLRDGQRLRVEGFEAGSVGFFLEDRAAPNP